VDRLDIICSHHARALLLRGHRQTSAHISGNARQRHWAFTFKYCAASHLPPFTHIRAAMVTNMGSSTSASARSPPSRTCRYLPPMPAIPLCLDLHARTGMDATRDMVDSPLFGAIFLLTGRRRRRKTAAPHYHLLLPPPLPPRVRLFCLLPPSCLFCSILPLQHVTLKT